MINADEDKKTKFKAKIQYYENLLKIPSQVHQWKPVLPVKDVHKFPILVYGMGALNEQTKNPLQDDDVLFEIKFVGVCHSDWHTILNEWKTSKYPVVAGHEMTGIVIETGSKVTKFKKFDKVALSPLYNSCKSCSNCKLKMEQYCINGTTETYNQYDRKETDTSLPTGPVTYGGYCNLMVCKQDVLFHFPDNIPMDKGAPLLCAGLTMFNAIIALSIPENQKENVRIGIAGIGGLGHIALKICNALKIKTVALTTSFEKLKDCKKFGTSKAIWMKNIEALEKNANSMDYIIDTIPFKHDLDPYIKLLKTFGCLCVVGSFYSLNPDFSEIIRNGKKIMGSNTAGTLVTKQYLKWTSETKMDVLPQIELITFNELNDTHVKLVENKCRYRFVIDVTKSMM